MTSAPSHSDRQKAQERFEFEYFRELSSLVPAVTYSQPDPPAADILVPLAGSFLAVELTAFSLDSSMSARGSASMARDRERERVLEEANVLWEAQGLAPVWVSVTWLDRVRLLRRNRSALAAALVRSVTHQVPPPGGSSSDEYPIGWKELQDLGVARVSIYGLREPVVMGWHSTSGGTIPSFRAGEAEIRRLLLEKEPNVAGYRASADEVWLVIVAQCKNPESSFHFFDEGDAPEFTSSFDRAFLVSIGWREFRELRIKRL